MFSSLRGWSEIVALVAIIVIVGYFYMKSKREAGKAPEVHNEQPENSNYILTVKIEGMMCERCAARVTDGLKKFGEISVNLQEKTATIVSNEMQEISDVENTINELGYKFEGIVW